MEDIEMKMQNAEDHKKEI